MKKGKYLGAWNSLKRLRNSELQAARDLYYIDALLVQEEVLVEEAGLKATDNILTRFIELFTIPRVRRATWAAGIVMIAQQVSPFFFSPDPGRNYPFFFLFLALEERVSALGSCFWR